MNWNEEYMVKKKSNSQTTYQIKITLKGSNPPIWRRFLVTSEITLGRLHGFLQPLMGWRDGHLHQFRIGNSYYADLNPRRIWNASTTLPTRIK